MNLNFCNLTLGMQNINKPDYTMIWQAGQVYQIPGESGVFAYLLVGCNQPNWPTQNRGQKSVPLINSGGFRVEGVFSCPSRIYVTSLLKNSKKVERTKNWKKGGKSAKMLLNFFTQCLSFDLLIGQNLIFFILNWNLLY